MCFAIRKSGANGFEVWHLVTGALEGRRGTYGAARRFAKYLNDRASSVGRLTQAAVAADGGEAREV